MLRFPLRLTADLTLARISQKLRFARAARAVQFLDAAEILHPESSQPVSHEKIREIISSSSPVVWIGGNEPLHHPGIAHLVRAITGSGHFVFLETDGTLLRRRIHEFQPVSQLFLTVRLEPGAQWGTSRSLRPGALELALEGIRAARLSGFLLCVRVRVHAETELGRVAELILFARSLDVDGIVIAPANGALNSANPDAAALQEKTAEARELIRSKGWESFSRLIEPVVSSGCYTARSSGENSVHLEQKTRVNEEGVKVA